MVQEPKSAGFFLRMSPTELTLLQALAEKTGLGQSDVLRQLIRREYKRLIGEVPAPKPEPKRKR